MTEPEPNYRITLCSAVYRQGEAYLPVIECRQLDPDKHLFVAAMTAGGTFDMPYDAARSAKLALIEISADEEQPRSEEEARARVARIGYQILENARPADVEPAEPLLESEDEGIALIRKMRPLIDALIQAGNPPVVKETFVRLVRLGKSREKAANLITRIFLLESFRQNKPQMDSSALEAALSKLPEWPYESDE